jgi:hypothetical protein
VLTQRRRWSTASARGGGGGSQVFGEASRSSSRSGDVDLCGGAVPSSSGGAPRRGSTVASPVDSVQGKDSCGLAEARGGVFGGKGGRERMGLTATLPDTLQ